MNIPRYWAKAERRVTIERKVYHLVAWQGSDESLEDAQAKARFALEQRITRKERGEKLGNYPKDGQPLREEIVEEIFDPQGERIAVITRNAAGCLVLNTAQVMFVDLDFANQDEPWIWPNLPSFPSPKSLIETVWGWLNPRYKTSKPRTPLLIRSALRTEEGLLSKVQEWHTKHPDWLIRVYRTKVGFRLLVLQELFDPAAQIVQTWMEELGADMRYMRLCKSQACFRARLTPKPWRIKGARMEHPHFRYPWANAQEEKTQREWERLYHSRIGKFAVCKVLANLGSSLVHPQAEQILLLHDQYVLGDRPLA